MPEGAAYLGTDPDTALMILLGALDGGDGASFTSAVASFPAAVAQVLEETGRAIGVDIRALLARGEEGAR